MPRVLKLKGGTYFMEYENIAAGHNGIITCRTSQDGSNWGSVTTVGTPVTVEETAAYQWIPGTAGDRQRIWRRPFGTGGHRRLGIFQ